MVFSLLFQMIQNYIKYFENKAIKRKKHPIALNNFTLHDGRFDI